MLLRHSTNLCRLLCGALSIGVLGACGSAPPTPSAEEAPVPVVLQGSAAPQAAVTSAAPDVVAVAAAPTSDLPPRAVADFDRAVNSMRAGNATEAELEFKQLTAAYPTLAAPHINLGLLYRKAGKLEQSEAELARAAELSPGNVVAWNELGVTRRMLGRFEAAAQAYERAIAADPDFAPAHRNFGVLLDLYLGDPERALVQLERYKELSGEEKPVSGWIAELRQRTGKPATPPPQPTPPPPEETPAAPTPSPGS